jgi:hypothetical protein
MTSKGRMALMGYLKLTLSVHSVEVIGVVLPGVRAGAFGLLDCSLNANPIISGLNRAQ